MRSTLVPFGLSRFLTVNSPAYGLLPSKQQAAATRTLYGTLTDQQRHNSGIPGVFPIHWRDKRRAYGSAAAFEHTNHLLGWFRLVVGDVRIGQQARGYCLTPAAREFVLRYLRQSLDQAAPRFWLETEDGKRYRKPQRAVRSLTASGANSTRFKRAQLQSEVRIDTGAVWQFYAASQSWLRKEECPPGCKALFQVWQGIQVNTSTADGKVAADNRAQRAAMQALAMLDVAKHYRPIGNLLPCTYVESAQGRLYAEGSINLQGCIRELRKAALKGCYDVDIDNCHWRLLVELAQRQGIETPHIHTYLGDKNAARDTLASDLEISPADAKSSLLALVYGAKLSLSTKSYPSAIQERIGIFAMFNARHHPILRPLYDEAKTASGAVVKAAKSNSRKPGWIINAAGRQISTMSTRAKILAHLLQGVESEILRVCMESLPGIVLVQHDGFCTRSEVDTDALSALVKEKTGYTITFSSKIL